MNVLIAKAEQCLDILFPAIRMSAKVKRFVHRNVYAHGSYTKRRTSNLQDTCQRNVLIAEIISGMMVSHLRAVNTTAPFFPHYFVARNVCLSILFYVQV